MYVISCGHILDFERSSSRGDKGGKDGRKKIMLVRWKNAPKSRFSVDSMLIKNLLGILHLPHEGLGFVTGSSHFDFIAELIMKMPT